MQAWYSLGTLLQSGRCSFHPLLREAGPLHDDNSSLQARGLVVLSFMPNSTELAPLDAYSCMAGLVVCHCGVRLVVLRSNVRDSVVVPSVTLTQFGSLCCIPASKALVPLVDSFLVGASRRASARPRSRPHVPRVPRGLHIAVVNHVGVVMALDAEHHVGLGPLAPFANIPSKRHRSAPHGRRQQSASGVHQSARPFYRRCILGLNWPGRAFGIVTLKKLECSKQAYALDTLA
uniref:Uncharacterized protein n=1 Tax=Quercus lobata TaxID=97700 RepID=A0A7N2N824_QUELO